MALRRTVRQIGNSPRFIEGHPRDDAGVADVARNHLGPLASQALDRGAGEAVRAWHLLPDQQAEGVGPIKIPRTLDLLVLARPIEPHGLLQFVIAAIGVVIRRGDARLSPVALIEDHPELVGAAIEHELVALRADGTE